MYLLYGDESGDPGYTSNLRHFNLSGVVVHESGWESVVDAIIDLKKQYFPSIAAEVELHYKDLRNRKGIYKMLSEKERIKLENEVFALIKVAPVHIVTVTIDKFDYVKKHKKPEQVDLFASKQLIKTYERFLRKHEERGILIFDERSREKLFRNALSYLQKSEFDWIIETIFFAPSKHLDLIQIADFCAYSVLSCKEWGHCQRFGEIKDKFFQEKSG